MADNLTLEAFLSLLDGAESVVKGDNLSERREFLEYSVSEEKRESVQHAQDSAEDLESCHDCSGCFSRQSYALPILNPQPLLMFVAPFPEGFTILSDGGRDYFNKWLMAMGLKRSDIALTTLIKCPVKEFRKEYADVCRKHLKSEMERLKPRAMVLLGSPTAEYMLRRSSDFSLFRGRRFSINSIPVFCTYSPEDLVKDRSLRAPIWEDLQLVSAFLKENQEK